MTPFPLKIVTPDGLLFDGEAEEILVRTTSGDAAILAGHINYVAPLGMGRAVIIAGGIRRTAACIGGMLSVLNGQVRLVATTWEWAEDIDKARAESARKRAEESLAKATEKTARAMAEARLRRALVRLRVAGK